jgi:hypothetical protein
MADALTLWLLAQAQAGKLEPTISGGPPSFTGILGQQVFDTKYGLTWWSDGTNWHANGPGQLVAKLYLISNVAVGSGAVVPFSNTVYDPLMACTTGKYTVALAGRYRVTLSIQAVATASFLATIYQNGGGVENGVYTGGSLVISVAVTTVVCAVGDTLQGAVAGAGITALAGAGTNLTVEFVSV